MENRTKYIVERYEGMYEAEGYQLVASANVYIPWFQCTLRCQCINERPMSELDLILCKCVQKGISSVKDISFVLALDDQIVEGVLDELKQTGMLSKDQNTLWLTEKGQEYFSRQVCTEKHTKDYIIYMNGITGEWKCDIINALSYQENSGPVISLEPIRSVMKMDAENHDGVKKILQDRENVDIQTSSLLDYKKVIYTEEKLLLFKNESQKVLFSLVNEETGELDITTADALMRKYERRELHEIMQTEKYIKQAEQCILEQDALVSAYAKGVQPHKYYRNKEIRELFKNIFEEAQKSIFIISPWISDYVMTEELLRVMENALLKRNIQITIGYGYLSKELMNKKRTEYATLNDEGRKKRDKDWQTELMAEKLRKRFKQYSNFSIFYVGTHEKILSYDDRYTLVGSYNLLSYDGGEKDDYGGLKFRFEGGVMIEDKDFARFVQETIGHKGTN